ncbi:CapA family protein [Sporosarcina thermotolerans]|uniref:CapA family protein n=1 Tax=Sporosarcina thermotolerans TaxID=633404 RepID=A0AAW9A9M3_9BACL|nr:CapA family protein [Sporosarcina thermotolerans]MDW0116884.1 CapA family protein [Sporosarcina thermotolerans]WHT47992.1 CapA family protein [Sporosarcina thermotolerans]
MRRIIMLILITGCFLTGCSQKEKIIVPDDFAAIQANPLEIELQMEYSEITVGMIGDILLHHPLYTYDNYDASFSAVKDKMTGIDFLIANQESLPGGVELGLSGYPRFNSPKHIIRDLKANGVDLLSIANNHTMDKSERGLLNAINYMNEYGMPYIGAYESAEDRNEKRIFDVKGIRVGVLNYTYGLNGLPVPRGKDYMVSLIDREQMEIDIREIRKETDVTVVSIHWGNEYALQPSEYQQELADWLAAQQVDIVFGHHPHVLQPYAEIGKTKIFYSLGNFYSAQQFDSTYIGGIAEVTVSKGQYAARSFVEVGNSTFYPTAVVRDENRRFVVVPLQEDGVGFDAQWVEMHVGLPK